MRFTVPLQLLLLLLLVPLLPASVYFLSGPVCFCLLLSAALISTPASVRIRSVAVCLLLSYTRVLGTTTDGNIRDAWALKCLMNGP